MRPRAFFFALALASCAAVETGDHGWYKEGGTASDRDAALAAAEVQAKQAHVQPPEERDIVIRSMTAQGWRLMPKQSAPPLKSDAARKARPPQRADTAIP